FSHARDRTRTSVQMITRAAHLERNPVSHNALTLPGPVTVLDCSSKQETTHVPDQSKPRTRYSSRHENDLAIRHSRQQQASTTRQRQSPGR
ncbi:hypothetical protein, partial [Streptomyces scabiei]|uniref:hypothetical protein n=1 Tax=Streptomyces scabiei TaxID=1930 RepID=UPI001F24E88C